MAHFSPGSGLRVGMGMDRPPRQPGRRGEASAGVYLHTMQRGAGIGGGTACQLQRKLGHPPELALNAVPQGHWAVLFSIAKAQHLCL